MLPSFQLLIIYQVQVLYWINVFIYECSTTFHTCYEIYIAFVDHTFPYHLRLISGSGLLAVLTCCSMCNTASTYRQGKEDS
jgi:hypothetical protein